MNEIMIIMGMAMIGFMAPESLMLSSHKVRIPLSMNLLCSVAFGLVTAGLIGVWS